MKLIPALPQVHIGSLSDWRADGAIGLVTDSAVWRVVGPKVGGIGDPVWRIDATEATLPRWDQWKAELPTDAVSRIVAVGGGLVHDVAKYLGTALGVPVTGMPTALSVDAFFTAAAGYRDDGMVRYCDASPPRELIVDFDVIAAAPASVRAAGVCDVLSIAIGCWDWKYAEDRGRNPSFAPYTQWAADVAQSILEACHEACPAAGRGDHEGLKVLLDCLALEVQLCNQIGHPRPEEGSEHAFAYSVENAMGHGLPHGDLVGPGIVTMARLQDNDAWRLERSLRAAGVPLESIPDSVVEATLRGLPEYVNKHDFYYGIAWDL